MDCILCDTPTDKNQIIDICLNCYYINFHNLNENSSIFGHLLNKIDLVENQKCFSCHNKAKNLCHGCICSKCKEFVKIKKKELPIYNLSSTTTLSTTTSFLTNEITNGIANGIINGIPAISLVIPTVHSICTKCGTYNTNMLYTQNNCYNCLSD